MSDQLVPLPDEPQYISSLLSDAQTWLATPIGTPLPKKLTLAEWEIYGHSIRSNNDHLVWKTVDWLLHAEREWNNTYHQFAWMTGLSEQTLREYVSVGTRTLEERRPELSFGHHKLVAALPKQYQRTLLDRALAERWSRETMRIRAREAKAALFPDHNQVEPAPIHADFTEPQPEPEVVVQSDPYTDTEPDPYAFEADEPDEEPAITEETWRTAEFAKLIAICSAHQIVIDQTMFDPPRPVKTAEDLVWTLCAIIRNADEAAAQASLDISAGRQAHQANATLSLEIDRLTEELGATRRELAAERRRTTVTAPANSMTIHVADNDRPYLRAIIRKLEQDEGVSYDPHVAVGHVLREHCSFLGLKVTK